MKKRQKPVSININLVAKDPFFASIFGKTLKWALSVGRYIVIFTELVVILSFATRFTLDRQLTDLNDSINRKKVLIESYGDLENNYRTLQGKLENYQQIEQQTNIVDSFPALLKVMPSNIDLHELIIKPDNMVLNGRARSNLAVGTLITNLQLSPDFYGVNVDRIESENEKSQSLLFSIRAETQEKTKVVKANQ
ncbi:MAG: PilN domain-containing protein [Patescibacteria group bacterium]